MQQLQKIAGKNVVAGVYWIGASSSVDLRCINYLNSAPSLPVKVLFVPGWISSPNSWRYFLPTLSSQVTVYYLETREKASSRVNGKFDFSIPIVAQDIINTITQLELQENEYVLVGSSLGATAILEASYRLPVRPLCLSLILPNAQFHLPKITPILKFAPDRLLPVIKRFVEIYIRNFRINAADAGHIERFNASMRSVDIFKLRQSALSVYDYKMDLDYLRNIDIPCLVIGASKDKQHNQRSVVEIANALPSSEYADLMTFTASHSTEAAKAVIGFISQILTNDATRSSVLEM
jgi:pimeloyl-ACP methyl ester carboxylesterase